MSELTMHSADIMLFEGDDGWVDKCITWLTNSTVSHAALYEGEGKLIEMCASGIAESKFIISKDGSKVYIMRLSPEKAPSPVVSEAQKYLNAKTRYDFPALVILAGLLIYRRIRPTPKLQKLTDLVINAAYSILDQLLQKLMNTEGTMVCSQLVYQCYLNCGDDYRIHLSIENDAVGNAVCLNNLLEERGDAISAAVQNECADMLGDPEALAKELYEALTETGEEGNEAVAAIPDSILKSAKRFLETVEKILEQSGDTIPVQALFVTPGDLLDHATNLSQVGTVNIERE